MDSTTRADPEPIVRARLLRQLTGRLDAARELASAVRLRLAHGDPAEIDAATARLETLTEEFKLLAEEYDRLPRSADDEAHEGLNRERSAMESAAAGLARSSAVTGGLLERMVAVSRGLLDLLALAKDGTYDSSGRASEPSARGVKLQERV